MSRTPRITGRELIRALKKAGFEVIRTRGSHHRLRHDDGRHRGETIGPGLLARILADCDMTNEELSELL
ncbi:MAG: type II toxin-antitoxin system HicA family toxin [Planctomycetota bacterium]|nr:type II toxin-antitoxin system HicA family toxin [Planctomycetota bacterium]MDA1140691.1 type II toxin-antitoxin system HicA family toxin [Planctomycetota bacterium]